MAVTNPFALILFTNSQKAVERVRRTVVANPSAPMWWALALVTIYVALSIPSGNLAHPGIKVHLRAQPGRKIIWHCLNGMAKRPRLCCEGKTMNLELTSIFRLLESASPLERISSRSVADEILRHQRLSGCGGDTMMVWLDQDLVLSLPKRTLTVNEAKSNRARLRKAAGADFYVPVYEDHQGVAWALLLTGHGLPAVEMDMFKKKVMALASV